MAVQTYVCVFVSDDFILFEMLYFFFLSLHWVFYVSLVCIIIFDCWTQNTEHPGGITFPEACAQRLPSFWMLLLDFACVAMTTVSLTTWDSWMVLLAWLGQCWQGAKQDRQEKTPVRYKDVLGYWWLVTNITSDTITSSSPLQFSKSTLPSAASVTLWSLCVFLSLLSLGVHEGMWCKGKNLSVFSGNKMDLPLRLTGSSTDTSSG